MGRALDFASGGRTLLATLTASNTVSLQDITSLTAAYKEYEIVFENLVPITTSNTLLIQVHSGGAFQQTSYLTTCIYYSTSAAAQFTSTTYLPLSVSGGVTNTQGVSGYVRIHNPAGTSVAKQMIASSFALAASGYGYNGWGAWNSNAAVDGISIQFLTGNISTGTVKIYGLS